MKTQIDCYECGKKFNEGYCYSCYNKLEHKKERIVKTSLVFIALLILAFTIPYFWVNVDEDSFCYDKVNSVFPEKNFTKAQFDDFLDSDNICSAYYSDYKPLARDGLKENIKGEERIDFILTDENDIEYMAKDDNWGFLAFFSILLCIFIFAYLLIREGD